MFKGISKIFWGIIGILFTILIVVDFFWVEMLEERNSWHDINAGKNKEAVIPRSPLMWIFDSTRYFVEVVSSIKEKVSSFFEDEEEKFLPKGI